MCDVYRFAKKVLIYLGEDSDGLDRAVDLLNMIYEKAQEPISRRLGEHRCLTNANGVASYIY